MFDESNGNRSFHFLIFKIMRPVGIAISENGDKHLMSVTWTNLIRSVLCSEQLLLSEYLRLGVLLVVIV